MSNFYYYTSPFSQRDVYFSFLNYFNFSKLIKCTGLIWGIQTARATNARANSTHSSAEKLLVQPSAAATVWAISANHCKTLMKQGKSGYYLSISLPQMPIMPKIAIRNGFIYHSTNNDCGKPKLYITFKI